MSKHWPTTGAWYVGSAALAEGAPPGAIGPDPALPEPWFVESGDVIEPGFAVPYRLYVHCGIGWLGELKKRHGDRLAVIAVAVESDEANVRKLAGELALPFTWVMGTPELVRALGDVSAVPTLLLFDQQGKAVTTFYGAPPTLHAEAEAQVAGLMK